jgi:hypothetical protein
MRRLCVGPNFFALRPNLLLDLAENCDQELTALTKRFVSHVTLNP